MTSDDTIAKQPDGGSLAPEPAVLTGARVGYARVSTNGQLLDRQACALTEAGCLRVLEPRSGLRHRVQGGIRVLLREREAQRAFCQNPNQGVRDALAAEPTDVRPQQQGLPRGFG
jgi:hypothetical protein